MTFDEAIVQINRKAGHRRDVAAATIALTLAIEALESDVFSPWFLLSEFANTVTKESEQRVKLPKGFIKGYEHGELFYENEVGQPQPLVKQDFDDLVVEYSASEPGRPVHYAFTNKYYRVFPLPDAAYNIFMLYYRKSDVAWTNPDNRNVWLEHVSRYVIAKAAIILMEDTRDVKGIAIQDRVAIEERVKLIARNTEHDEINVDRTTSLN